VYDVQQISKEVKTLESLISKKPKNKKGKGIWREMYYQRIILQTSKNNSLLDFLEGNISLSSNKLALGYNKDRNFQELQEP